MMEIVVVNLFYFLIFTLLNVCNCHLEQNASENDVETTCDSSTNDCGESAKLPVTLSAWKPFIYESNEEWVPLSALFPLYVKWHKKVLHDSSIPCEQKKVFVFSPNAGLGDSIGALTSAFSYAVKAGRLFFIDWKPYEWTVGFSALPFDYDYSTVKNLLDTSNQRPLLCAEGPGSFLEGHVTNQHPIVDEIPINNYYFSQEEIVETFLQPAPEVAKIVNQVVEAGFNDKNKGGGIIRLVAIVIRTGQGEYNQFLSKGDEEYFVKCFINFAKSFTQKSKAQFCVFVTSDNDAVKQYVVDELTGNRKGNLSIEVISLFDSIIHVMHVQEKDKKKKLIQEKICKTYAEYFLLSRSQVMFLTHGSLFGRAAADRGRARETDVHFLSDSNCDGKREKYSYLECHEPKYPTVCGFS